jgi:hypothetical protein
MGWLRRGLVVDGGLCRTWCWWFVMNVKIIQEKGIGFKSLIHILLLALLCEARGRNN